MKKHQVHRGGSYRSATWNLRSSFRLRDEPEFRNWNCGFRLVVKRRKR